MLKISITANDSVCVNPSGEERRLRSKNSKTDKTKAFWETAGLQQPIDGPAMAKSTTQSRMMVEV